MLSWVLNWGWSASWLDPESQTFGLCKHELVHKGCLLLGNSHCSTQAVSASAGDTLYWAP